MIIFDQLRLSDDGKRLYVNVHVNTADYFDDVYLDSISIMSSDRVSETNPFDPTEDCLYTKAFDDGTKEAALVLTATDFSKPWEADSDDDASENAKKIVFTEAEMSKTLFFVYVTCKGTVAECTPCSLSDMTTVGVTFDEKLLYQRVMDYTKALADDCNVPVGFTDFILLWNAFKASVETEHYIPAIKYWNMLFDTGISAGGISVTKTCGCHG